LPAKSLQSAGGVSNFQLGATITAIPVIGCGHCEASMAGYATGCNTMRGIGEGFAEYMRVDVRSAVRLPASLSISDGALVEPLAVGLRGVTQARTAPCARVSVLGAGVVGLSVIFWARRMAAGRILAMSPSTRRAEMAGRFGADRFETLGDDEAMRIEEALGGAPDVVFECAGALGALQKSADLVRQRWHDHLAWLLRQP
jgi:threonine dehydrogenase-like Zn-dependent dehydrogenase